jgi:hypothetical protein
MKSIKTTTYNIGTTAIISPVHNKIAHLSTRVHETSRFNDNDELIDGYTVDDGECFFTNRDTAIKKAKEMFVNNTVLDFIFDNELENLFY